MNSEKHGTKGKENKDTNFSASAKNVTPKNKAFQIEPEQKSKSKSMNSQGDDKIKVYLRVRPALKDEEIFDFSVNDKTITIPPQKTANSSFFCDTKTFTFRSVLNSHSKQAQVYEKVAEPMINDFLKGNDVLIFCYGNTNAGKTYTVMGTDKNPGILLRLLNRVVPELLALEREDVKLYATFNEIYNERIIDLLSDDKQKEQLTIGISNNGDTEIKGCVELPINSIKDVQNAIKLGLEGRHRGSTEFNSDSSRSHTVFRLKYVNKRGYSWLSVVDLAGSERVSVINSAHGSFREACNINKSMLVLGKCIRSLREQSTPGTPKIPIPYRESKLTHIFKNLFEPTKRQAKAAMIINISPSIQQINDTLFALQFAAKASECSIKQVINPNDLNGSPGASDYSPGLYLEQAIDPDSPQMIERRKRVEIQKEMEEYLLQRQMQYEHQIQILTRNLQESKQASKGKSTTNTEVENLTRTLAELQSSNEETANELSKIEAETDELKEKASNVTEERSQLQRDIELLKQMLESLSSIPPSEQTSHTQENKAIEESSGLEELYKLPEQVLVN